MTTKRYEEICRVYGVDMPVVLTYDKFKLTGKLIACCEGSFVVDVKGHKEVWPRELCEFEPQTYAFPSYS